LDLGTAKKKGIGAYAIPFLTYFFGALAKPAGLFTVLCKKFARILQEF
jgi:hypothetical protein